MDRWSGFLIVDRVHVYVSRNCFVLCLNIFSASLRRLHQTGVTGDTSVNQSAEEVRRGGLNNQTTKPFHEK